MSKAHQINLSIMAVLLVTDEVSKLFFDSASDLAKPLITVSTAVLGLSITFLKEIVKEFRRPVSGR